MDHPPVRIITGFFGVDPIISLSPSIAIFKVLSAMSWPPYYHLNGSCYSSKLVKYIKIPSILTISLLSFIEILSIASPKNLLYCFKKHALCSISIISHLSPSRINANRFIEVFLSASFFCHFYFPVALSSQMTTSSISISPLDCSSRNVLPSPQPAYPQTVPSY